MILIFRSLTWWGLQRFFWKETFTHQWFAIVNGTLSAHFNTFAGHLTRSYFFSITPIQYSIVSGIFIIFYFFNPFPVEAMETGQCYEQNGPSPTFYTSLRNLPINTCCKDQTPRYFLFPFGGVLLPWLIVYYSLRLWSYLMRIWWCPKMLKAPYQCSFPYTTWLWCLKSPAMVVPTGSCYYATLRTNLVSKSWARFEG